MAKANANAKSILDSILNIGYILDTDWKHYCCIWSTSPTVYLGYILDWKHYCMIYNFGLSFAAGANALMQYLYLNYRLYSY